MVGAYIANDFILKRVICILKSFLLHEQMVKYALLCKPGGEDVIQEYKEEKSLTHRTRRKLVNILASHMTESHG